MAQANWLALALILPLAACGGRGEEAAQEPQQERSFLAQLFGRDRDRGPVEQPLVAQVLSVNVDTLPGGVVVRAVGLPPQQGYWDANLVQVATDNPAVIALEFRLTPPERSTRSSTQRSREVLAGTRLSRQDLAGVREIRVIAVGNTISRRASR